MGWTITFLIFLDFQGISCTINFLIFWDFQKEERIWFEKRTRIEIRVLTEREIDKEVRAWHQNLFELGITFQVYKKISIKKIIQISILKFSIPFYLTYSYI